jgi:hypothetical protein
VPARARRLAALAALQAAVTLSWMAYAYYQPRLLARFGFESLAAILAWYLTVMSSTLAPLAGAASDRLVRRGGDRFAVVRVGAGLAAASFLAVAAVALADGDSPVRWVLPLFVAVWIAGMTIFQAPALALVRDVVGDRPVAPAMPPLIAATVLPQALWPWLECVLAGLGGSATFLAGGCAVVGTALGLGRTADVRPIEETAGAVHAGVAPGGPVRAFACGVASGLVALLAADLVPPAGTGTQGGFLAAGVAATAAVVAPLASRVATAFGNGRTLVAGLALAVLLRLVVVSIDGGAAPAVAIAMGVALALHLASALPFALAALSPARAGVATGLYLGGAALGSRIAGLVLGS